jgi:hypothetical protein
MKFLGSGLALVCALAAFIVVVQPLPAASHERVVVQCSRNGVCREQVVRRIIRREAAPATSTGGGWPYDYWQNARPCGYAMKC